MRVREAVHDASLLVQFALNQSIQKQALNKHRDPEE